MPDERGPRYPPWHGDSPGQDCDAFFGGLEKSRRHVMGDKKHYCKSDPSTASRYMLCDCTFVDALHRP